MLYIAENLKTLRKQKEWTQEEAAEAIGVSPQSVSKWERGDTYPDITLLPALANLYSVSLDALIGMDRINDAQARAAIFRDGRAHLYQGENHAAEKVYTDALKTFPNDEGFMSELALVLSLEQDVAKLGRAIELCERVLDGSPSEKVRHTTRAALCFLYYKAGEEEKAYNAAANLPHIRESRESVLNEFYKVPDAAEIDEYLRFLALGGDGAGEIILIDCAENVVPLFRPDGYDLLGKIGALREELDAPYNTKEGVRKLPIMRVRDNVDLPPNRLRLCFHGDYLIDREFEDLDEAVGEVLGVLRKVAK